ncbi:hypothetical protein PDE_09300 [Penicillium oxalicum 114-2]|uniref:Uncharacterized protein n=1 Tax=Penicillium oxalicum (strain 114-2 / CGMCC 5302) TaxID=933388 RepID=S7ZZT8_PENO1|nr:hypothetical protein PDE_09300 [Penicillium oxalicum 114-2]
MVLAPKGSGSEAYSSNYGVPHPKKFKGVPTKRRGISPSIAGESLCPYSPPSC